MVSFPHHTDGGLYECALLLREEEESEEKKRDRKTPPPYPNIGLSHIYNIRSAGEMSALLKNVIIRPNRKKQGITGNIQS